MNQRHYLLRGTFLLTVTGLLTRAAGFFYKIFLSRTIGAAQIGRYHLTLPVCAFCMALSCGGVQTAVSRFTAEYSAKKELRAAKRILACALLLSVSLALCCSAALIFGSDFLASAFLLEPSCAVLLRMLALSFPFSAVHGCVNGYFLGRRQVSASAASQMVEQLLRISSVLLFSVLFQKNGRRMDAAVMALGELAGELSAALFCLQRLAFGRMQEVSKAASEHAAPAADAQPLGMRAVLRKTLSVSAPLSASRMLICVLQSIESALLPQMLMRFGHSTADALSVYGTLTGMTLPLLLFPTAVTGALGTLLLPAVSEAKALQQNKKIAASVRSGFTVSLLLGYFFLAAFLLFGDAAGRLLFHSRLAGTLTKRLALICPFLYINTTMTNVLHGLGKTSVITACHTAGFLLRLLSILAFVPFRGINAYLLASLLSYALTTAVCLATLHRSTGFSVRLSDGILRPGCICILSALPVVLLRLCCARHLTAAQPALQSLAGTAAGGALYAAVFAALTWSWLRREHAQSGLV